MSMVRVTATENDQLSEGSLARLAALKDRPIDCSDIPESTPEEMEEMRQLAVEMRKRQMFSLRLQNSTISWWRENIGEGYTGIMARLLDKATKHLDWIKECL